MTDEVTARRAAKRRAGDRAKALGAALNARSAELQPHALAIMELLHAVGLQTDEARKAADNPRDLHIAEFVFLVAVALGVSRVDSLKISNRLNSGGDETE